MNNIGLSRKQIRAIMQKHLDKNADLVIGIDDPELVQLIEVLCEGIAVAIEQNNQEITSNLNDQGRNIGLQFR